MDLKEVYSKLESMEGGTDLITAIKTEVAAINAEAAKHRNAGKESAAVTKKLGSVLTGLGLEDGEDLEDKVATIKATLDGIAAKGGKPDEVLLKFGKMEKELQKLQAELKTTNEERAAERMKHLETVKRSKVVEALTKGNAAKPDQMAKILMGEVVGDSEDALVYKLGDKDVSIEEGAAAWLKENSWAVRVSNKPGSGAPAHSGGAPDDFTSAFMSELNINKPSKE